MKIDKGPLRILIFILALLMTPAAVYSATVTGKVLDGSTDAGISGAVVVIYNDSSKASVYFNGTTDSSGSYTTSEIPDAATSVYITFTHTGHVETFGAFSVQDTLSPVYLAPTSNETGIIRGIITDATTTDTIIPQVTLSLYAGVNTTTGTVVAGPITSDEDDIDSNGYTYEFTGIAPGSYTILATKDGYFDSKVNVVSIGGEPAPTEFQILMSSRLSVGNIRIVLTWGANPSDIDSHLYTPEIGGTNYHIYYASRGSQTAAPYVGLDVDDVTSYGPETTTIYQLQPGIYKFTVEYFAGEGTLAGSGAKVEVYNENGFMARYYVPATAGSNPAVNGDEWVVFYLDGSTGTLSNSASGASAVEDNTVVLEDEYKCFIDSAASSVFVKSCINTLCGYVSDMFKRK